MSLMNTDREATVNELESAFQRKDLETVERIVRSGVLQDVWCDLCGCMSAQAVCSSCVAKHEARHVAQTTENRP